MHSRHVVFIFNISLFFGFVLFSKIWRKNVFLKISFKYLSQSIAKISKKFEPGDNLEIWQGWYSSPNLGGLFRGSFYGGGKITLENCGIMLETSNLTRKYTYIFSFRIYNFYYQESLNFADGSIFFAKKSAFFWQKYTFT